MSARFTRIIGWAMLVVFLYGTVPRELLHDLFAQHADTVEVYKKKGAPAQISEQHRHCSFLAIDFGAYLFSERFYIPLRIQLHYDRYQESHNDSYYSLAQHIAYLRGPPACTILS